MAVPLLLGDACEHVLNYSINCEHKKHVQSDKCLILLVRLEGFEPPAYGLEVRFISLLDAFPALPERSHKHI